MGMWTAVFGCDDLDGVYIFREGRGGGGVGGGFLRRTLRCAMLSGGLQLSWRYYLWQKLHDSGMIHDDSSVPVYHSGMSYGDSYVIAARYPTVATYWYVVAA